MAFFSSFSSPLAFLLYDVDDGSSNSSNTVHLNTYYWIRITLYSSYKYAILPKAQLRKKMATQSNQKIQNRVLFLFDSVSFMHLPYSSWTIFFLRLNRVVNAKTKCIAHTNNRIKWINRTIKLSEHRWNTGPQFLWMKYEDWRDICTTIDHRLFVICNLQRTYNECLIVDKFYVLWWLWWKCNEFHHCHPFIHID